MARVAVGAEVAAAAAWALCAAASALVMTGAATGGAASGLALAGAGPAGRLSAAGSSFDGARTSSFTSASSSRSVAGSDRRRLLGFAGPCFGLSCNGLRYLDRLRVGLRFGGGGGDGDLAGERFGQVEDRRGDRCSCGSGCWPRRGLCRQGGDELLEFRAGAAGRAGETELCHGVVGDVAHGDAVGELGHGFGKLRRRLFQLGSEVFQGRAELGELLWHDLRLHDLRCRLGDGDRTGVERRVRGVGSGGRWWQVAGRNGGEDVAAARQLGELAGIDGGRLQLRRASEPGGDGLDGFGELLLERRIERLALVEGGPCRLQGVGEILQQRLAGFGLLQVGELRQLRGDRDWRLFGRAARWWRGRQPLPERRWRALPFQRRRAAARRARSLPGGRRRGRPRRRLRHCRRPACRRAWSCPEPGRSAKWKPGRSRREPTRMPRGRSCADSVASAVPESEDQRFQWLVETGSEIESAETAGGRQLLPGGAIGRISRRSKVALEPIRTREMDAEFA